MGMMFFIIWWKVSILSWFSLLLSIRLSGSMGMTTHWGFARNLLPLSVVFSKLWPLVSASSPGDCEKCKLSVPTQTYRTENLEVMPSNLGLTMLLPSPKLFWCTPKFENYFPAARNHIVCPTPSFGPLWIWTKIESHRLSYGRQLLASVEHIINLKHWYELKNDRRFISNVLLIIFYSPWT